MLDDNTHRLTIGIVAVIAILAPVLFMFSGGNWDHILNMTDQYANSKNIDR